MGTTIILGLDVGGTKTTGKCQLHSNGTVDELEQIDTTGLNLKMAGVDAVCDLISDIVESSRKSHSNATDADSRPSTGAIVCAGIAGAGSKRDRQQLSKHFQEKNPGDIMIVHADTSGSNVYARDRAGRVVSAGGWGRLIGDPGSGYQIGLESLRVLSERIDESGSKNLRLNEDDVMLKILDREFDLTTREDVIEFVYNSRESPAILARAVVMAAQNGDTSAQNILLDEIQYFVCQIERLTRNVTHIDKKFVHMGGLAAENHFSELFSQEMRRKLPEWESTLADESPAAGAFRLAQSHAAAL